MLDAINFDILLQWAALAAHYSKMYIYIYIYIWLMKHGVEPNVVTAISVLSACSHGKLIEEGLGFFNSIIKDHRFEPGLEH